MTPTATELRATKERLQAELEERRALLVRQRALLARAEGIGGQALLDEESDAHTKQLAQRDAENAELIERLRIGVAELAIPILQVGKGVLVVPIIGTLDSERSAEIAERLLSEVVRSGAAHVIVDITGVELMDTSTADRFAKLASAVELLGARCSLSGVQPSVAQTLITLGVSLERLSPYRNLAHALTAPEETK